MFLNVALGALNLIPANPLDGYKVVVGLIWSLIGTESSARKLIQRVASAWLAVEGVGACVLLVAKPALGSLVLVMAALLTRSLLAAQRTNLGFPVERLAVVSTDTATLQYGEARSRQFYNQAIARIRTIPGVASVGSSTPLVMAPRPR